LANGFGFGGGNPREFKKMKIPGKYQSCQNNGKSVAMFGIERAGTARRFKVCRL
jgi:hypothetical protein